MKETSKQFLQYAVSHLETMISPDTIELYDKGSIFPSDANPIVALFTEYTTYEIDNYENIINSTNEFFDFLTKSEPYKTDKFAKFLIGQAQRTITRMINKFSYENNGQKFANLVYTLSPTNPQKSHILDVGPGEVPYSSLALATGTKQVSAMDESFLFSNDSLKAMNVNSITQYFDQNTNIDDYDFVVGSFPCTAIPYIVQNCAKENKPYFLLLCDCATYSKHIPILNDFAEIGKYTWKSILPELDPKITMFDDYAFNLGATEEQVKRVISKINLPNVQKLLPTISADQLVFDSADVNVSISDTSCSTWTKE